MSSYIVTMSPKGQITIPVKERGKAKYKKYLLEVKGNVFIIKPVEIKILDDEMQNFSSLAESSFDFWDDEGDDIYQEFYK